MTCNNKQQAVHLQQQATRASASNKQCQKAPKTKKIN